MTRIRHHSRHKHRAQPGRGQIARTLSPLLIVGVIAALIFIGTSPLTIATLSSNTSPQAENTPTAEAAEANSENAEENAANASITRLNAPKIISRTEWGADGSLYNWAPEYSSNIEAVVIHHTGSENYYSTKEEAEAQIRNIYRYHAQELDWGDIGYHFIVDKFGNIYEGRAGSATSTVKGSHAYGYNVNTIGIVMLGNYDEIAPSPEQITAIGSIAKWKLQNSGHSNVYETWEYGGKTLPRIHGHRDNGSTDCPGEYGYAALDDIRASAAQYQATSVEAEQPDPPRVYSAIALKYYRAGGKDSGLGLPAGEEESAEDKTSAYQLFDNGAIAWARQTDAYTIPGKIGTYWVSTQPGNNPLNFPTSEAHPVASGTEQQFHTETIRLNTETNALTVDYGDSSTTVTPETSEHVSGRS